MKDRFPKFNERVVRHELKRANVWGDVVSGYAIGTVASAEPALLTGRIEIVGGRCRGIGINFTEDESSESIASRLVEAIRESEKS